MIDGVPVNDAFGGVVAVSNLEVEAVKDLEVITGTFNAEYGNAMSGVVNAVTKDGSNNFSGSLNSAYSTYLTNNEKNGETIFIGLEPVLNNNTDFRFNISGPIIRDKVYFFSNFRRQNINGWFIWLIILLFSKPVLFKPYKIVMKSFLKSHIRCGTNKTKNTSNDTKYLKSNFFLLIEIR